MTIVYPAHLIIDHAGFFDHIHQQESTQLPADESDEEICQFCFNMAGMLHAEPLTIKPIVNESGYLSFYLQTFQTKTELVVQSRAPPFVFFLVLNLDYSTKPVPTNSGKFYCGQGLLEMGTETSVG